MKAAVLRGDGGMLLYEALWRAPIAASEASDGVTRHFTWGLPGLLARDEPIVSCIAAPRALCAGLRRRDMLIVDTQDAAAPPPPPWAAALTQKAVLAELRQAARAMEAAPWVPYCHHLEDCGKHPAWTLYPMLCMGETHEGAVAIAGLSAVIAEAKRLIPGLLNVAFSRSATRSHITPHCDGREGLLFHRFQLAVTVPAPAAHFRICGDQMYEFKVGELFAFNNSLPHEVMNLASRPRVVLLLDVLTPELLEEDAETRRAAAMGELRELWASSVRAIRSANKQYRQQAGAEAGVRGARGAGVAGRRT